MNETDEPLFKRTAQPTPEGQGLGRPGDHPHPWTPFLAPREGSVNVRALPL